MEVPRCTHTKRAEPTLGSAVLQPANATCGNLPVTKLRWPAIGGGAREAYDPAVDPREKFLTDAEMAFFVDAFKRTGFTGGINWYRNISRNWRLSEKLKDEVSAPSLMIMAEKDAVLPPSSADGMEQFVPNLEKVLIKESGHWTQQEKPKEVTAAIAGWMKKTFR